MEHRHPKFSSKLMVMLGKALVDLLRHNSADFQDLMRAYGLPHFLKGLDFVPIELEPEDYVRELAKGDPDLIAVRLIEAIHKDLAAENAAVFTTTNKTTAPGQPRERVRVPLSFISLTRELATEGFTFRGGKLVPFDPDAPQEFKDKTELAARVRSHDELDPKTLIHHIEESDSTLDNRNWGSAASEARNFLEGLVVNVSKFEAERRKEEIPNLPKPDERRSEFGPCREYLKKISLTRIAEDRMISSFWSFASVEGSHYGVTPQHMATLTRRFCWVLAAHLLTKYESQSGTAE